jgi:GT2 family glycosyltransferase
VICVLNDPGKRPTRSEEGVLFVGVGMNLGWAAGLHAGLVDVESEFVWAIQDDLFVGRGAHRELVTALRQDSSLASVRPLPVDARAVVPVGSVSSTIDDAGRFSGLIPAIETPAAEIGEPTTGSFLPSSGQFIRRTAWDETGGFDPWFYPWGYIDVDFGRTLREAGWGFRTVVTARMQHDSGSSTNAPFRELLAARNRSLYVSKWAANDRDAVSDHVDQAIVRAVRAGRGRPRDHDVQDLRAVVGVAASDTLRYCAGELPHLVTEARRPLLDDISAANAARDAAEADSEFVEEQFRSASAQRDAAIEQREAIFNSRAWSAVTAYWRLRRRILGR